MTSESLTFNGTPDILQIRPSKISPGQSPPHQQLGPSATRAPFLCAFVALRLCEKPGIADPILISRSGPAEPGPEGVTLDPNLYLPTPQ